MRRYWTKEQLKAVFLKEYEEDFILVYGGFGSGKSSATIKGYTDWTRGFQGRNFGMVAKTNYQKVNVLLPNLRKAAHELSMPIGKYRASDKTIQVGANTFHILDGADVTAAERMQGADLSGVYVDEAAKIPGAVLEELVQRIRAEEYAKMVMTCNPEEPTHDFYLDYVMRSKDIGMKMILLNPKDNPTLSSRAVQRVIDTSVGGQYAQRIDGDWVPKTGLVYNSFYPPEKAPGIDAYDVFYISVDPGYSSSTHALLVGKLAGVYWVIDELRMDFLKDKFQLSDSEQADRIKEKFSYIPRKPALIVVDSAAQSLKRAMRTKFGVRVIDSDKRGEIIQGIPQSGHYLRAMLHLGMCRLSDNVERLERELLSFGYEENRAKDVTIKSSSIHGLDALRYLLWSLREVRLPIDVRAI